MDIMDIINFQVSKLFECERYSKAKNNSAEQRKEFRLAKEKPLLEAFWKWLDQQKPNKGTRLDKAVNYAQNRKDTLMTYLEDGHCSLSNNLSENAIRPFTVGRRNWLFSASPKGAAASSMVYTMVEMAKANDLNTYKYRYDSSRRDTQTIYNYAEDGGLIGNGGFWAKTKVDFERNIKSAFGKWFK